MRRCPTIETVPATARPASATSPAAAPRELLRRWYAAWNAHDVDAIVALTTDDLVYEDPGATQPLTRGREPLEEWARAAFRAVPDMKLELLEDWLSPSGAVIVSYFRFTATFTGVLEPPGIAPNGACLDEYGMDRSEIRSGLIACHQIFWDTAERSRMLGLLPRRGSRAERLGLALQRLRTHQRRTLRMSRGARAMR